MSKRTYLLFFLLWLLPWHILAQLGQLEYERYTVQQGLSNNTVFGITQDEHGYLWVGTENGLNQFDGTSFKTFYQNRQGTGIPGNYVEKLKYFGHHQLGIATRRGFQVLNTQHYTHTNFLIKDTTVFYTYLNSAMDMVELKDAWAMVTISGFYVFKKNGSLQFRYDHYKNTDVGKTRFLYGQTIFRISDRYLLLYVLDHELGLYDIQQNKLIPVLDRSLPEWKNFVVRTDCWTVRASIGKNEYVFLPMLDDSIYYYNHATKKRVGSKLPFDPGQDLYWASYVFMLSDSTFAINGRYGGIYEFHINHGTGKITCNPERQLKEHRCNWIFKDRENRFWIGTNKGLLKQRTRNLVIRSWHHNKNPQENNAFFNKIFATEKYIFLCRNSWTDGIRIIDAKTMELVKTVFLYGKTSQWNSVYSIQNYYKDTLWMSTAAGILWMNANTLEYGKVNIPDTLYDYSLKMAPAKNGKAWMCGILQKIMVEYDLHKRTFTIITPGNNQSFPNVKPKHVLVDVYGDTWLAGHGLARLKKNGTKFDRFMAHYQGMNRFEDNILLIQPDDAGSLWLHSPGNGLLRYDIKKNTFTNYATEEGIPADISSMSEISDGKMWLGTRYGLLHFDTRTGMVTMFNQKDGLPDDQFTSGQIYFDAHAGRYLVGMNNYLAEFAGNPHEKKQKKHLTLRELIIRNSDTIYFPKDILYLDHDQNSLAFTCNIIDFDANTPYQLAYRLDGQNSWNLLGQQPVVYLDHLLPGKHILEIKTVGHPDNITARELTLYVNAPWWKKPWFMALMAVLVLLCLYLIFRQKLKSARKEGRLNQLLAEYEMKALHAQMNPHFIFNCLNSIKALVMYDRNQEASVYINRFSRLVRQNLDHSRKPFISLQQNIEYLRDYLEMEKFRFTNFQYHIQVDEKIPTNDVRIAPMLLQPLVENAIWHGLQMNDSQSAINIRFIYKGSWIDCEIEDNGIGIKRAQQEKKQAGNSSLGIENIQQRMKVLNEKYNLSYRLTVVDRSDLDGSKKGTLVTVSFNSI